MTANTIASACGSRRHASHRARVQGFTLIELLIVMVCIAILAATAMASYEYATIKARRGAAQGCLTEYAQYMERYYTTNMKYTNAAIPTCSADVSGSYAIDFASVPDATSYTLRVTPQGRQAAAETKCGTMTIDQTGQKTGSTPECWQ